MAIAAQRRQLTRATRAAMDRHYSQENTRPDQRAEFGYFIDALLGEKVSPNTHYPIMSNYAYFSNGVVRLYEFDFNRRNTANYAVESRAITIEQLADVPKWIKTCMEEGSDVPAGIVILNNIFIEGVSFNKHRRQEALAAGVMPYGEQYVFVNNMIFIYTGPDARTVADFTDLPIAEERMLEQWTALLSEDIVNRTQTCLRELRSLRQKMREQAAAYGKLQLLHSALQANSKQLVNDVVSRVKALPGVEKLIPLTTGFNFITDDIWVTYDNTRYYLGKYEVQIMLNGTVQFRNLRQKEFVHPHSSRFNSDVCLGSYSDVFINAFANMDLVTVAVTALEYVRTFNSEDANARDRIKKFPKKMPDEKATIISDWIPLADF